MRESPSRTARVLLAALAGLFAGTGAAQDPVTVRGRVVTPEGEPIADAALTEYSGSHPPDTSVVLADPPVRSDADGRFEIPVGARSRLYVAAPGRIAVHTGRLDLSGSRGDRIDVGDVTLHECVTLVGRVRDEDGAPLPGVRVQANVGSGLVRYAADHTTLTSATTDAEGVFHLPCSAPGALRLLFFREGYYARRLHPVALGMPLSVELERSGFVTGRVAEPALLAGGKVYLLYAVPASYAPSADVAADGTFRIAITQRGPFRVVAYGRDETGVMGPALTGPAQDVVLGSATGDEPAATPRTLVVRAVEKATGRPVTAFEAALAWGNRGPHRFDALRRAKRVASVTGAVRLPVAPPQAGDHGVLHAVAEGHGEVFLDLPDPPPDEPVVVEFGPARTIRGQVVDAATGEPIAGAHAWLRPIGDGAQRLHGDSGSAPASAVTTDAEGGFRLEGCAESQRYELQVFHPDWTTPHSVPVAPTGAEQEPLRIALSRGARITFAVEGPAPHGAIVQLDGSGRRVLFDRYFHFSGDDGSGSAALVQGRATFEHRYPGEYAATLRRSARTWLGCELAFDLGKRNFEKDTVVEIDANALATGWIGGRVAGVPFHRVLVAADQVDAAPNVSGDPIGSALEPSGAYRIEAPVGTWRLRLVDLLTGATFAVDEELVTVEKDGSVARDFAPEYARVALRVRAEESAPRVARIRIENLVGDEETDHGGFSPDSAEHEWQLLLRPGAVEVQVIGPSELGSSAPRPSVSGEVRARRGETTELEIAVPW